MNRSLRNTFIAALAIGMAGSLQAADLYLGDGAFSVTNVVKTWDTTTANWATDTGASNWVTWSDNNDAYIGGFKPDVFLADNLVVTLTNLVRDAALGISGLDIVGSTNTPNTINILGALNGGALQVIFKNDIEIGGGSFAITNASRVRLIDSCSFASATQITSDNNLQLWGTETDFSTLSVTGGNISIDVTNKVIGSLTDISEIALLNLNDLTVSNLVVGTDGVVSTNQLDIVDTGTLTLGSGTHKFDIGTFSGTNSSDYVHGVNNLVAGGTLEISLATGSEAMTVSNVFALFPPIGISGTFDAINVPTLGGGLVVETNQLHSYGWVYVTDGSFTPDAPVDETPVANDDAYSLNTTVESNLVVDAALGVLNNDTYGGFHTLSALLENNVSGGILSLGSDGSFTYTPTNSFTGDDTFTYKTVSSGGTTSTPASVTITVSDVVPKNVLIHLSFDTDLSDSSGTGNDGGFAGSGAAITNGAAAKFGGGALSTAGAGYVSYSEISFDTDSPWSISFWYNAATTAELPMAGDHLSNNSLHINDHATDRSVFLRAGHRSDVATFTSPDASPAKDTGVWHHIVVTSSGTGNDVKAYEDGVQMTGTWPGIDDTAMKFNRVGSTGLYGVNTFNGLIDELWIANYVFSTNEITSLYDSNDLSGGSGGETTNLPATIVSAEVAPSNTLKVVVSLEAGSVASEYSPVSVSDLVGDTTWDPIAHSDAFDGTFAVTNLDVATDESGDYAIYIQTTNTADFIRIEADLIP